jgi:hypothetical protein
MSRESESWSRRVRAVRLSVVLGALLAGTLVSPGTARAQRTPDPDVPYDQYADRQYIFANIPNTETRTWFEAQLAPRFSFWQGLRRAYDTVLAPERAWQRGTALSFTMLTRIRMTTETSAPVRTPSYMPKLTLQLFRMRRGSAGLDSASLANQPLVTYTVDGTVGHYSNGQDGCLFEHQQQVRAPVEHCEDIPGIPTTPLRVNRRDGSFSMHYLEAGLFRRATRMNPNIEMVNPQVGTDGYWSIGGRLRYHVPERWVGGGMSPQLRDVYGAWRVNFLGDRVWRRQRGVWGLGPGHVRLEGFVELLPGVSDEVPPVRFAVEVSRAYYERSGWGSFLRYYYGQDYYNLGFLTKLSVVQLGALIDQDRLPNLKFFP